MPMTDMAKSLLESGKYAFHQTVKKMYKKNRKHLKQQQRHRRKDT